MVLSAVKRAERGDGVVVRVYNPLPEPVTAELTLVLPFAAVRALTLNEEDERHDPAKMGAPRCAMERACASTYARARFAPGLRASQHAGVICAPE